MPSYITSGDYGPNGEHITVTAHYDFYPYIPESGPSYASGGEPAEGGYAIVYKIEDEHGREISIDEKAQALLEEEIYEDRAADYPE